MIAYFAYRLPGESTAKSFKGNISEISKTDTITKGVLISSFNGEQMYAIADLEPVNLLAFEFHLTEDTNIEQTKYEYEQVFTAYKSALNSPDYEKLVLSRIKIKDRNQDPLQIFNALNSNYSNTFNYLLSAESTGTWLAATPELLLKSKHNTINTVALAGTKTPNENWTEKEKEEQHVVLLEILKVLQQNNCAEVHHSETYTADAGKIQHLKTDISAVTNNKDDWKKILFDLHPTPAVCGLPTEKAKTFILANEKHERSLYTGFVGLVEENTKQFYVNLRCMQLTTTKANLFVGGGITAPSNLEREWEETERKSGTLGQYLNR